MRNMADDTQEPANAAQDSPHIYRPVPRRNFEHTSHNDTADSPIHAFTQATPPSLLENRRSSDFLAQLNARLLRTYNARSEEEEEMDRERMPPPQNKSFLNLTSSTLFGIYDDVGTSTAETPWGTGAETPAHSGMGVSAWETGMGSPDGGITMKNHARKGTGHGIQDRRKSQIPRRPQSTFWKYTIMLGKLSALFSFGVVYGLIISHLHDTRQLAAVRVGGVDRRSWIYSASWGLFGVALGSLLPYVDLVWDGQKVEKEIEKNDSPISEQINDVVRSVCAFVGIAFAIRRLPWQSTLQLTITLALVNPALWYILDRSKPGLSFALGITSILTSFIFLSNPDALPSPSLPATTNTTHSRNTMSNASRSQGQDLFAGMISYDNLAVVTWVGSVLFCSCVCFGSIGRRLAVLEESGWKRSS